MKLFHINELRDFYGKVRVRLFFRASDRFDQKRRADYQQGYKDQHESMKMRGKTGT